jgi:hypothetical protein
MSKGRTRAGERDAETVLVVIVLGAVAAGVLGGLTQGAVLARLARPLASAARLVGPVETALVWLAILLGALAVAQMALRAIFTWRTLRSRRACAVLPPEGFEPKPEAIEAFGQQLLGARRRVLTWLDRPACAVRVELSNTADGRLLYSVAVPRRFSGSLFNAYAAAYPGVQLEEREG